MLFSICDGETSYSAIFSPSHIAKTHCVRLYLSSGDYIVAICWLNVVINRVDGTGGSHNT